MLVPLRLVEHENVFGSHLVKSLFDAQLALDLLVLALIGTHHGVRLSGAGLTIGKDSSLGAALEHGRDERPASVAVDSLIVLGFIKCMIKSEIMCFDVACHVDLDAGLVEVAVVFLC